MSLSAFTNSQKKMNECVGLYSHFLSHLGFQFGPYKASLLGIWLNHVNTNTSANWPTGFMSYFYSIARTRLEKLVVGERLALPKPEDGEFTVRLNCYYHNLPLKLVDSRGVAPLFGVKLFFHHLNLPNLGSTARNWCGLSCLESDIYLIKSQMLLSI